MSGIFDRLTAALAAGEPVALATVLDVADDGIGDGPERGAAGGVARRVARGAKLLVAPQGQRPEDGVWGTLGTEGLDVAVRDDARGMLGQGTTGQRRYGVTGQRRRDDVLMFVESFVPPPRMYVFGAIDYAAAVARIGTFLGYHVTVCDARAVFATPQRFPDADEVVVEWPHRFIAGAPVDTRTAICVLTHDPKFDVPVLKLALATDAGYIGAMGSRRTHDERLARLRAEGVPDAQLARLRSPIGLDIGGRTPEETAVSVAAEIIQLRWSGSGLPLSVTEGAIHAGTPGPPR